MADANSTNSGAMDSLVLVIKNPARSSGEDFSLQLSSQCTIRELKQKLREEYEGNPLPECQTVRPLLPVSNPDTACRVSRAELQLKLIPSS